MSTRLQRFSALLILRVWPVVIATDLIVTAFVARPMAISQRWIDAVYDIMAICAAALNLCTLAVPANHAVRAVTVGATATALAGRASWLMAAWERPASDRVVASVTYLTLAVASMICGFTATRVATFLWDRQ